MKRVLVLMGIWLIMSCAIACGQKDNGQKDGDNVVTESYDVEYLKQLKADPNSIKWGDEEDTQAYMTTIVNHQLASYNGGYYYATAEGDSKMFLSFIDPESGLCTPVCSQPQCDHTSEDCTAVYDRYSKQVWFYKEKLYFIRFDSNGKTLLTESQLDGTGRKDLFEIGNNPQNMQDVYNLCFVDDSVFIYNRTGNIAYLTDESMQIFIRMRSLDGKVDKEIVVSKETNSKFEMLKAYKGNLFFVYTHSVTDANTYAQTTTSDGLYCYNIKDDEIKKVVDAAVCDYVIDDKNNILYYYVIGEGIYRYTFDKGETKKIYEADNSTSMCMMSYDGQYIYFENSRHLLLSMDRSTSAKVYVIDKNGNMINTIETVTKTAIYFGDNKYLLHATNNDDANKYADGKRQYFHRMYTVRYIDKKDIHKAKDWKRITWNE